MVAAKMQRNGLKYCLNVTESYEIGKIMITGVDYILYTDKSQDALIEKIKLFRFGGIHTSLLIMKMKQQMFIFPEMRRCFS